MASAAGTRSNGVWCSWIIDSGASDHMTYNLHLLQSFKVFILPKTVTIANRISLKVMGKGTVMLADGLTLFDVLYVPGLNFNLISISRITRDNNCRALFSSSECLFQEKHSRKMIGNARQVKGLYVLRVEEEVAVFGFGLTTDHQRTLYHARDNKGQPVFDATSSAENLFCNRSSIVACTDSKTDGLSHILLWHHRLGHPNFIYLKKLMPHLFTNVTVSSLRCDSCILSKQTKSSYLPKPYRPSCPFNLVHSDIWGPSRVANINGSRWFITFVDDHTRIT